MKKTSHLIAALLAATAASLMPMSAMAATKLRVQLQIPENSDGGQLAGQFANDVNVMSNGEIELEMYYGGSLVKEGNIFDAAVSGVVDCDMSTGGNQVKKNPAFQFVGDIMGGYSTPYQQLSWLYYGDGLEAANKLYNKYDMQLVGWWVHGMESLGSTKPLAGPADLKGWKFRLPNGMGHDVFGELGATPIHMPFSEVVNGLETGLVEGADASNLSTNKRIKLYETAKHTNYPGFHSMPSDHLACSKEKWDSLSKSQQRIISVAMQKLALQTAMNTEVKNGEAAATLPAEGVTLYDWSAEDREAFRNAARRAWEKWAAKTPEARALVDSHVAYMKKIGLLK